MNNTISWMNNKHSTTNTTYFSYAGSSLSLRKPGSLGSWSATISSISSSLELSSSPGWNGGSGGGGRPPPDGGGGGLSPNSDSGPPRDEIDDFTVRRCENSRHDGIIQTQITNRWRDRRWRGRKRHPDITGRRSRRRRRRRRRRRQCAVVRVRVRVVSVT